MSIGNLFGTGGESNSLYGTSLTSNSASSFIYFEWFIFKVSTGQPATPTGGSWDFATNTGTPPTGWTSTVSGVPLDNLWFSIAFVDSRNPTNIVWSAPGLIASSTSIYATAYADTFTGNGSTTNWTLTQDPVVVNNLDVSINGVTQTPIVDYTISGTTFTTTTAAPLGSIILVKYRQALPNSYFGTANNVGYTPHNWIAATNVQAALDEVADDISAVNGVSGSNLIGYLPSGTGAVATTVQNKLRQFVTPEDFGAIGNGIADDTAALQLAINYCMTDPINPLTLLCAGRYYITSTLMINATGVSVTTIRNNKFKILGVNGASAFYAAAGIVMFSATANHSTQSVGRGIQWENIAFESTFTPSASTSVLDGAFIQVTFEQCTFTRVYCQRTTGVNTFSYWFFGCQIQDCPTTFFELLYTSANDVLFDGCYFNNTDGNAFPCIHLSLTQGFKCTNNTFESIDGTPIVLRGSRSADISGNYFEACGLIGSTYYIDLNEAGTGELAGVSVSGNLFFMTSGQDADLAFYAINWDAIAAGSSNGNWCSGKLHHVVNAQPGYDLSINGDTESTTGNASGRATIRPTYRQFTSLGSNWFDYQLLSSAPSAREGRVYYNSTTHKLYCHDGTTWQALF